jgi:guanylate kinase
VSRDEFLTLVSQNKFIEYTEFSNNLYGTSVKAVKDVEDLGKICILDIELQVRMSSKNDRKETAE